MVVASKLIRQKWCHKICFVGFCADGTPRDRPLASRTSTVGRRETYLRSSHREAGMVALHLLHFTMATCPFAISLRACRCAKRDCAVRGGNGTTKGILKFSVFTFHSFFLVICFGNELFFFCNPCLFVVFPSNVAAMGHFHGRGKKRPGPVRV